MLCRTLGYLCHASHLPYLGQERAAASRAGVSGMRAAAQRAGLERDLARAHRAATQPAIGQLLHRKPALQCLTRHLPSWLKAQGGI